ncbi:MAG: pilus assembly protein [Lachnospiraceae bacterium]|nr:pilus assembly protein [Lachnospiraceae bacterium]
MRQKYGNVSNGKIINFSLQGLHKRYLELSKIEVGRKEDVLPKANRYLKCLKGVKTLLFAPLKASLTVEAALVLPMFLFCMIAALQYCRVMETAVQFGTALSETGKTMAVAAYATTYIGETGTGAELAASTLSLVYAQNSVTGQVSDTSSVKNVNMALSALMQEDEMIDLVLTYQIRTPVGIVNLPGSFFIQRSSVRAWVGRSSEESSEEETGDEDDEYVYVTATGTVYHRDAECTYLKPSVFTIDSATLAKLRNNSGEIYYACELCGAEAGAIVYATTEGNRYHSSLSCSALKRTVTQVKLSEVGDLHACSKCG